jgi:hypothetical protein
VAPAAVVEGLDKVEEGAAAPRSWWARSGGRIGSPRRSDAQAPAAGRRRTTGISSATTPTEARPAFAQSANVAAIACRSQRLCLGGSRSKRSHVERVALEGPPLVRSAAQRTRRRYFRPEGFDIVSSASADLPYDPHRIEPVAVYTWRSRRVRDDAEGASSASVSGLGSANGSRGVRRGAAATPLTSTSAGPCVSKFSGVF